MRLLAIVPSRMTLYRYRYPVAYLVLAVTTLSALLGYIDRLPQGFSRPELESVVRSLNTGITPDAVQGASDVPYHLLQHAAISLVGVSPLSVRIASIVFAAATVILFVRLLHVWFHGHIAMLAGILLATSVPLVALGRIGTPEILQLFWPVALLLTVTLAATAQRWRRTWQVVAALTMVVSLYSPLSIYLVLAILITAWVHPHSRFLILNASRWQYIAVSLAALVLLLPLLWYGYHHPSSLLALVGFEGESQWTDAASTGVQLARGIGGTGLVLGHAFMAPLLGVAVLCLALLGIARTVTQGYAVRSYTLLIWCIAIAPAVWVHPGQMVAYVIPLMLFMAIGLELLIDYWYSLFPFNPYARLSALLPLTILLAGVAVSSMAQYTYTQLYAPRLASLYDANMSAVARYVAAQDGSMTIVAPSDVADFYHLLERRNDDVRVALPGESTNSGRLIVLEATGQPAPAGYVLDRLVVSDRAKDALVARVYVRQPTP